MDFPFVFQPYHIDAMVLCSGSIECTLKYIQSYYTSQQPIAYRRLYTVMLILTMQINEARRPTVVRVEKFSIAV